MSLGEMGQVTISMRGKRSLAVVGLSTVWRFAQRKPLGAFGISLVLIATALSLAAPIVAPYDPWETRFDHGLEAPNRDFWFGTDVLGRDVLSRVLYGGKISIYVGLVTMLLSGLGGVALGVTSGYIGGQFDLIVQRVVDSIIAFPSLILALALIAALDPGVTNIILAIAIVQTPRMTRVIRSSVLSIRETPYVDAARTIGATHVRIMLRHVTPNTFAPLMIVATSSIGSIIITEASLSFLGIGVPFTTISWGGMLGGDTRQFVSSAVWMALAPGFALSAVVFGLNMFGDALRDVLDPKLRGR